MGEGQSASPGRFVAWAIGLAPVLLLLLTWGEALAPWQSRMRTYAVPVVAVEIGVIALAALRRPRVRASWPLAMAAALAVLAWGTAAAALHPAAAVGRTLLWSIHLLFGLAVALLWRRGMLDRDRLVGALLGGFAIFTALLVAFVASVYRPGYPWVDHLPAYSNIRWYGYYAAAAVALAVPGIAARRPGPIAVATLALAMALWTGARGPVVAIVGGLGVGAVAIPELREPRLWARLAGIMLIAVALSALATLALPLGEGPRRLAEFGDSQRLALWRRTLSDIAQHPWFGWGDGQVRFTAGPPAKATHPHNVVLQVLHAWGIAGLVLVGGLALQLARQAWRRLDPPALPFACAALVIAAYSLFDGSLYQVHSVSLFAICAACLAGSAGLRGPDG